MRVTFPITKAYATLTVANAWTAGGSPTQHDLYFERESMLGCRATVRCMVSKKTSVRMQLYELINDLGTWRAGGTLLASTTINNAATGASNYYVVALALPASTGSNAPVALDGIRLQLNKAAASSTTGGRFTYIAHLRCAPLKLGF